MELTWWYSHYKWWWWIAELKQYLFHYFLVKYVGWLWYFLGIEVAQSKSRFVTFRRKDIYEYLRGDLYVGLQVILIHLWIQMSIYYIISHPRRCRKVDWELKLLYYCKAKYFACSYCCRSIFESPLLIAIEVLR